MRTRLSPRLQRHRRCVSALSAGGAALLLGLGLSGCPGSKPGSGSATTAANPPSPQDYQKIVSAFYTGLIALATGDTVRGPQYLTTASQLAPQEPIIWADLALAHLQPTSTDLDAAARALSEAAKRAPKNSPIMALSGLLESKRGNHPEAIKILREAAQNDPNNVQARNTLIEELKFQPGTENEAESERLLQEILKVQPDNLAVQLMLVQQAAKLGHADLLRQTLNGMKKNAAHWPADVRAQFGALEKAAAGSDVRQAATNTIVLENVMKQLPAYKPGKSALQWANGTGGIVLERFLVLPTPSSTPSPPDEALSFTEQPLPGVTLKDPAVVREIELVPELPADPAQAFHLPTVPEGPPAIVVANGSQVQVISSGGKTLATTPFPSSSGKAAPPPEGVLPLDFNYTFRPGLALAGTEGFRLLKQGAKYAYTDVTAKTGLPSEVLNGAYVGAWAADIEADGDLDIVLAPVKGQPFVLQNNGDGTWKTIRPFAGVTDVRAFAWADLDGDGDADAAMIDAQGRLFAYENLRSGAFQRWESPKGLPKLLALSVADANHDGVLDLVALTADKAILRISRRADGTGWETQRLAQWTEAPTDGTARLFWADLDNNGGADLIASGKSGTKVWLCDAQNNLKPLAAAINGRVLSVGVSSKEGKRDLLGVSAAGQPVRFVNRGTKNYHWQIIRPRAAFVAPPTADTPATGDSRINSFGVGGEIEARAGLLYQKQPITGPTVHFGLGENAETNAARIIWPNGSSAVQGEFSEPLSGRAETLLKTDATTVASQRLNGSCPWLFAWDGKGMKLVTDCIWRSPLGLKINAQDTAGVMQTQDWVKIRGDQLAPHDGYYDLRICAELWETHFFDHLSLMTVDHPENTEIWVDERFSVPPPPLAVIVTTPTYPIARAVDDLGHDVTAIISARDGNYLDTFGRGQYQGVTRDHYVEIELSDKVPQTGPLYLIATGWIHPTDSSINVAISQGHHEPPRGLSLEIPDGKGGWTTAKPGLGFPEGKIKTVVLDLTDLFSPGIPRRLRLRTNLEIYWDFLGWAAGRPDVKIRKQQMWVNRAELRYRGFSATHQADRSSPEMPAYDQVSGGQRYLDLEGYYTRYGDVTPLLRQIDDHYVIMNAGDELALQFIPLEPPPYGWKRDFILIGDGWVKDGNFNTTFSKTVLPLPAHDLPNYDRRPGRLEDDPVYRRHPEDWKTWHTRYVAPDAFRRALRPSS
jgi:hypothetical protein